MTTPTLTVSQARAALEAALTAEQRQRRKVLIDRLEVVRHTLLQDRAAFEKIKLDLLQGQADLDTLRKALIDISDDIGNSASRRPRIADILPLDPEVQRWQQKHRALEERQQQLINQRSTMPNVELLRLDAVQLGEKIKFLGFEEENLLNELQGSFGIQPGGVFAPQ